jgi:LPXTG-motif cell wall-anchored protein
MTKINTNIMPEVILQAPWIAAIAGAAFVAGFGTLLARRKKTGS